MTPGQIASVFVKNVSDHGDQAVSRATVFVDKWRSGDLTGCNLHCEWSHDLHFSPVL